MKKVLLILLSLSLLAGCWDERQFKNVKLVMMIGYDKGEDGKIIETVSIPTVQRSSEGPGTEIIQIVSEEADTPREARNLIDQKISDVFDPSKMKVLVLGEELAKQNIYTILDEFYRNPNNNLNAHIVLSKGQAKEIISFKNEHVLRISDYISGILEGAKTATHSTGENIQLIGAELFEPGEDFSLPILQYNSDENTIEFAGLGLFSGNKYTGIDINPRKTTMFLLMQGVKGDYARITRKVSDEHEVQMMNYVTINVMRLKRDIKIKPNGRQVEVDLNLKLNARVVEFPSDNLVEKGKIQELNKKLSDILTKDAEELIGIMQEANSDIFAIGRRLHAFYPELYKKLDWKETYPTITITPKVEVNILQHGVIN